MPTVSCPCPRKIRVQAVNRPITLRNHPFPLLLYLEWGLLAIALLSDLLVLPPLFPRFAHASHFPLLKLLSIVGFGLMGFRLPTRVSTAIPYTLLQFGWLALATLSGGRRLYLFPLLYIVLVIRSCLMFPLVGQIAVTATAFWMFIGITILRLRLSDFVLPPGLRDRVRPLVGTFFANSMITFGLALLFVLFLVNALMAERASQQRLTEANQQLRDYALRVENLAMAQERSRIAREIHDSLGHSLTALNLQLETALKLWPTDPHKAHGFLQEAKKLGSTALRDVRQSVATMRTDPLQRQSLEAAIATLAHSFHSTTGITPTCSIAISPTLSPDLCTGLYRIIQEALTNIVKHAQATEVAIQLHQLPTGLSLRLRDNGQGFQAEQNSTGFGLQGMRERTLALGGRFQLQTAPGQGTVIDIDIPMIR